MHSSPKVCLTIGRRSSKRPPHSRGATTTPHSFVFVIIDEYADLQTEIDTASGKEEKEVAKRLSLSLTRISRRARSVGIVMICALQKPTTDAMDSSLRSNLNCRICFRVGSSQLAASMLDGLDDAPVAPTSLRPGRFIYYDGGKQLLAQAQIAPGIDLAGS
jgi:DNA segregation ATPase FtsK/SpoIIIE, S-DNA-T family